MSKTLPFQSELRPALPTVIGNVDYQKFEKELKRMDEVLILSGVEERFVESCVAKLAGELGGGPGTQCA